MPATSPISTVFDTDNHYWESSDAFTRHRNPAFADRGVTVKQVDGHARYFVNGQPHPIVPGPGDVNPRPRPGALYEYFAGRSNREDVAHMLTAEDPKDHPEWFNRDARLTTMDDQGVEACWMFPSQGVTVEGPMQPDVEASIEVLRAFNRWIEEDWGFAYKDRIFAVPFLTLSDLDCAVAELEWSINRGARIAAIRPGPVFTKDGRKSPADPCFDPFWARVAEAGLVMTVHAGFEDGYQEVDDAIGRAWGYASRKQESSNRALGFYEPFVETVMHYRLIHDFLFAITTHKLFERHPRLRVASIENGAHWVSNLLRVLAQMHHRNPGWFTSDPRDQFKEHVWIAPFVEDDVAEIAHYIPVERILFGSDWPHAEGMSEPKEYLTKVASFTPAEQQLIMRDNARQLTFG
jgi:predicted TIM-barrel fold metal-dependent hydrolase